MMPRFYIEIPVHMTTVPEGAMYQCLIDDTDWCISSAGGFAPHFDVYRYCIPSPRVAACVAACEGVDTEDLTPGSFRSRLITEIERGNRHCDALQSRIAELEAQLEAKIADDARLVEMHLTPGAMEAHFESAPERSHAIAAAFASIVKDAPNYVEMTFVPRAHGDTGDVIVTVQKAQGKTPHAMREIAEARAAELEAQLASRPTWTADGQLDARETAIDDARSHLMTAIDRLQRLRSFLGTDVEAMVDLLTLADAPVRHCPRPTWQVNDHPDQPLANWDGVLVVEWQVGGVAYQGVYAKGRQPIGDMPWDRVTRYYVIPAPDAQAEGGQADG